VSEIVHRIRYKCGSDFPIGVRYSGEEWIPGSRELEESVRIAKLLEEHGVASRLVGQSNYYQVWIGEAERVVRSARSTPGYENAV